MSSVKRVDFEVDFMDDACKSTWMQENLLNTADAVVSIIPGVRVAVPVGAGVNLEDRLRGALRVKGLALTTEETYVGWYRRDDSGSPLAALTPRGAA